MPATSKMRRAGPGGHTTTSSRSSSPEDRTGSNEHVDAARVQKLHVREIDDERSSAFADRRL